MNNNHSFFKVGRLPFYSIIPLILCTTSIFAETPLQCADRECASVPPLQKNACYNNVLSEGGKCNDDGGSGSGSGTGSGNTTTTHHIVCGEGVPIPDHHAQGDGVVMPLVKDNISFFNEVISNFNMADQGWDLSDLNDISRDGTRIMSAFWILKTAGRFGDAYHPYDWAAPRIDKFTPVCSLPSGPTGCEDGAAACNTAVPKLDGGQRNYVTYRVPEIVDDHHILDIASTILHEAAHSDQDWKNISNWSDGHPGWPNGPYALEVKWLAWFAAKSDPSLIALRAEAANRANSLANTYGFPIDEIISNDDDSRVVARHSGSWRTGLPRFVLQSCADSGKYYKYVTSSGQIDYLEKKYQAEQFCSTCNVDIDYIHNGQSMKFYCSDGL